ncbi:prepilin-type N-terminal cleavage/methylation domain-containing protein [Acidobacteriota bacterium]
MFDKRKGFTLIELLVVVAIIAILAILLIPNAITAIQKTKQKKTMKQIVSIATACADYVTDRGQAPASGNQSGPLTPNCEFVIALAPPYMKNCPVSDEWGHAYHVYSGTAVSGTYNIPGDVISVDDFLIASLGRDGIEDGWVYDPDDPAYLYTVQTSADFLRDMVNLNGTWLHGPRIATSGPSN